MFNYNLQNYNQILVCGYVYYFVFNSCNTKYSYYWTCPSSLTYISTLYILLIYDGFVGNYNSVLTNMHDILCDNECKLEYNHYYSK